VQGACGSWRSRRSQRRRAASRERSDGGEASQRAPSKRARRRPAARARRGSCRSRFGLRAERASACLRAARQETLRAFAGAKRPAVSFAASRDQGDAGRGLAFELEKRGPHRPRASARGGGAFVDAGPYRPACGICRLDVLCADVLRSQFLNSATSAADTSNFSAFAIALMEHIRDQMDRELLERDTRRCIRHRRWASAR